MFINNAKKNEDWKTKTRLSKFIIYSSFSRMLLIRNIIKIQQLSKYLDLQQVQIIVGVAHENINITKLLEII